MALAGKTADAQQVLSSIPGAVAFLSTSPRIIPPRVQLTVFRRDSFTCRYCQRRTIFLPVLRALSLLFPSDFRWHPHSKMTECHVAFWRDFASCDHLIPVARGGSSQVENLVTACYMCNSIKQNWLIEELRWTLQPTVAKDWDGLSFLYPKIIALLPVRPSYYDRWLNALRGLSGDDAV